MRSKHGFNGEVARIALIEDHPDASRAFVAAVELQPGMEMVGTAADVDEGFALLHHTCPTVLVVDLGLPSGSGLALIREARSRWGKACASAVFTMTGNEAHLLKAIQVGASGYLFKSDDESAWVAGLQVLAAGGGLMAHGLARHLLAGAQRQCNAPWVPVVELVASAYAYDEVAARLSLTEQQVAEQISICYASFREGLVELSARELELLGLLNQGLSFKESARLMGTQESTVKTQAARAYQKLGATNMQEALYAARREHLFR